MEQYKTAEEICDLLMMRQLRRFPGSYWLIDIKDGNTTPKVVMERDGKRKDRWKSLLFDCGTVLCQGRRTLKECREMTELKLSQHLEKLQPKYARLD